MLFSLGQSGEAMMLFSLGQSSDCFAILRNLLEKHHRFPAWRPTGAKDDQILGLLCNPAESTRKASSLPCMAPDGR